MNLSREDFQKAINGEITFQWRINNSIIPLRLNKSGKEQFQVFIRQGFGLRSSKSNAYFAYSVWCSIEKKPQVSVYIKRKYAHVEIDMIFTDYCISLEGQELIGSIVKNYFPKKIENISRGTCAGGTYSSFDFIPKDKVEIVVNRIVGIIRDKEFLIERNSYNNLDTINEHVKNLNNISRKVGNKKEGYVYFIQAEDRNIFKIGYSKKHPQSRIKSLQNGSPYDLFLRHFFYSIDCESAEKKVHKFFEKIPRKREWFFITPAQIIKAIDYFHSTLDVALDSNDFQVIAGKYLVLKSKIDEDNLSVTTEKCPFCGKNHCHGSGGVQYQSFIDIQEGIKTLGHRSAHCSKKNIEFITPNGTIVNNNDGYYLGINI